MAHRRKQEGMAYTQVKNTHTVKWSCPWGSSDDELLMSNYAYVHQTKEIMSNKLKGSMRIVCHQIGEYQ